MKNKSLKIMLSAGCILLFIVASASSGPAIIFFPLLIVGVILTVVSLWLILSGLPKMMIAVGTIFGLIGIIIAYFGDQDLECTAMIIIGFGVLIGCIAVIAGYSDIEDVTGWDKDI